MNAAPLPILYASHDGQTRKIVHALAAHLKAQGKEAVLYDLAFSTPLLEELGMAELLIIMAPIRYGYHLPPVERFIKAHASWLRARALVMLSVNLTARKQNKNTPATNPYLRKWIKRHRLTPIFQAVLAGRLDYGHYPWWERHLIRLIMYITGGPTNLDAVVDYTPWEKLPVLAGEIVALCQKEEKAA